MSLLYSKLFTDFLSFSVLRGVCPTPYITALGEPFFPRSKSWRPYTGSVIWALHYCSAHVSLLPPPLQLYWPVCWLCHMVSTFPHQGLCTCCSLWNFLPEVTCMAHSLFPLGLRSNATLPERCKIVMPPRAHPSDLALLDFLHSTYYHLTWWVLTHLVVYYLPLPIDYKLHKDKDFDLFPATSPEPSTESVLNKFCWMNEWFMPPPVSTVCGRSFGGVCPTPYNPSLWEMFFPNHGGTCRHSFSMWPSPWHCFLDQSWKAVEPMRISETLVPSFVSERG